jgi:predicted dehydrogenase
VRVFNELEDAAVAGVCDTRPGRLDFIRRRFPFVNVYADAKELLNDPSIDAVAIATPPQTHLSLAMDSLHAGKHVLVEKPLATSTADAETLVKTAEQLDRCLAVGHPYLYAPPVVLMRSLLQKEQLGDVYCLTSTRTNLGPPGAVMDVVWDLAPHDISIALDLMGETPEEIETQGGWFTQSKLAETAFLTLRFSGARLVHIHVSWLTPNKTRLLQIVCQRGVMVYDDTQPVHKLQIYETGQDNRIGNGVHDSHQLGYGPGNIWIPPLSNSEPLRTECQDFVRCLRERSTPYSSGRKGIEVVRVLEKVSNQLWKPSLTQSMQAG